MRRLLQIVLSRCRFYKPSRGPCFAIDGTGWTAVPATRRQPTAIVYRTRVPPSLTTSPSQDTKAISPSDCIPTASRARSLSAWSKAGSTIAGLMESFGTVVSVALQHGVPLQVLVGKLSHTRLEPSGWTGNEQLGYAKSIMDYLFGWLELRFLSGTQLPLFVTTAATSTNPGEAPNQTPRTGMSTFFQDAYEVGDAPLCSTCGALMVRNGSCNKCANCGGTSGCS